MRFTKATVVIVGYVIATVVFYIAAALYIDSIGDLGAIPTAAWIFFGPALGLGSGHGIPAYFVASIFAVPLSYAALRFKPAVRYLCIAAALFIWVGIGWFMVTPM